MGHKHFEQLQMQDVGDLDEQLSTKADVEHAHAQFSGIPYRVTVPAGSTTPTLNHQLNTTDVEVAVYDTATGVQVGIPSRRVDADNVQLTFSEAPTVGQYRAIIASSVGTGGSFEGGIGQHAFTHAAEGADPVTPASIGAAIATHTHSTYAAATHNHDSTYQPAGSYAAASHTHTGVYQPAGSYSLSSHTHQGLAPNGGTSNQALTKLSNGDYDYGWRDIPGRVGATALKPFPPVNGTPYVKSSGLPTPQNRMPIDATQGTHYRFDLVMTAAGGGNVLDMYVEKPTNPVPGQTILFEVRNTHATLPGVLYLLPDNGYSIGDQHSPNLELKTQDYIVVMYDERGDGGIGQWRILSWAKGFSIPYV